MVAGAKRSFEHAKLPKDMGCDFMLKDAGDLLSPVVLKEGAVLESGDVLENRVHESFRFRMHPARRIKNDWLKLEFQGFCGVVVFIHFLVVALLGSESGLC